MQRRSATKHLKLPDWSWEIGSDPFQTDPVRFPGMIKINYVQTFPPLVMCLL